MADGWRFSPMFPSVRHSFANRQSADLHPLKFQKSALLQHHPFIYDNRRAVLSVTYTFLLMNKFLVSADAG